MEKYGIKLDKEMGNDLYLTYLGTYNNNKCVVKFYGEISDANNEYEVLCYLSTLKSKFKFPTPYLMVNDNITIEGNDYHKFIVYEYLEGEPVSIVNSDCYVQIREQLEYLHKLNLVHGDLHKNNILRNGNKYYLIDYGRTFRNPDFPPMQFMIDDDFIPTKEDEIEMLNRLLNR